jgi:hypothetical protein
LYDALIAILDDAFDRLKKRPDIEREVGSLFRSKHFNLYKRRNQPPRWVGWEQPGVSPRREPSTEPAL